MSLEQSINLPRRGNRFTRGSGRFFLNLLGWSFSNDLPDQPKQVVIVAPHTSNWDFIIGILAVFALGIEAHWIGKHTLFFPPLNFLMEWLGGIPVNRKLPNDLVKTTTARFNRDDKLILGIAPEGTRRKVEHWKKGYYLIAVNAAVPIVCASLDYGSRTIRFGLPMLPTGDYDADFRQISDFFAGVTAKHPDQF